MKSQLVISALSLSVAAILSGCGETPASPAVIPALPSVPVAEVVVRNIEPVSIHPGRIEASQRVELRPRVAGTIEAVLFNEGDLVSAGQVVLRIDPRPFDAAVARAQAQLAHADARLVLASAEAERARRLAEENAISGEERERRFAARQEAQAQLDAARAALDSARLDREFADVRAPISGRIGRALVTRGNFVAAGLQQSPLTTIVASDSLHVYFDVTEGRITEQLAAARRQGSMAFAGWRARVLPGESGESLAEGRVDFANNEIGAGTGTLTLRASIAGHRQLMPGMFTRVQLVTGERKAAVLVDDKAISTDQGRRFVLVANGEQVLEYRPVTIGPMHEGLRVIESGLAPGDAIVVNGLMKVRPGMSIKPNRVAMHGNATPIQTGASAQGTASGKRS